MKRSLIVLVQLCISAAAGYVAWRVAAHRLHWFGTPAIAIGLFVFPAVFYFLARFRRGGTGAALFSLLPIAGAALLCLMMAGLVWTVDRYSPWAIDNPALTAAWLIVFSGALGAVQRAVAR
jgi:hypothetical protein